ncbi:MAG: PKD domain-containing protein [Bacteroidetes bacterium]|nr:PKD domain-containing protein [Bacteroidota bacterium]MCB0843401.1 PKD domain-containing protein [Bacteroidota bacterium]
MMGKKPIPLRLILASGVLLLLCFSSCKKEEITEPPTANIFYSVADKQVAFTALTTNAENWTWDFGDGNTSTDKTPVHVYDAGGVYTIKLSATGPKGSADAMVEVSLALSVREMLTGGASDPDGKTWKISAAHSDKDAITFTDPNLTVLEAVPAGALSLFLGLGEEYEDEFTFKADGSYSHDTKNGGAFAGLVFTLVNQLNVVKITPESQSFGFAVTEYTPETGATFTLTEGEDFSIEVVSQLDKTTVSTLTFKNATTLDFSGTEFIGLMDFTRKCVIQEITPDKMRLVMFMSATDGNHFNKPSLAVIFTFEKV